MNEEYISVKEFAKRANVSVQSIYKKLNDPLNPLNQYFKLVECKKCLNIKALQVFYSTQVENNLNQVEQLLNPGLKSENNVNQQLIDILRQELTDKTEQLKVKDNQIEQLQNLLSQEQMLHARTQEKLLLLQKKEVESVAETAEEIKSDNKSKWWKKIFN